MGYHGEPIPNTRRMVQAITLITLIVASFTTAVCSITSLPAGSRVSPQRGLCLFAMGFIFFPALYSLLNSLVFQTNHGHLFQKHYSLTTYDILDINNKIVSAVQAVFSSITGIIVSMSTCPRSFLRASHAISEGYAWFGAAYFFYDIWSMFHVFSHTSAIQLRVKVWQRLTQFVSSQPVILIHHVLIGTLGFLVIVHFRRGLGDCVFGFVYLMELSTPFVSIRGILSKLKLKSSRFYVWNGLMMLATFLLCRILMFPFLIMLYSWEMNWSFLETAMSLPTKCKIGILTMFTPQLYWLVLMTSGAVKVVFKSKRLPSETFSTSGGGDS